MDSHEINGQPRSAMHGASGGGAGVGVRRRPPTSPYYGTNEEDALLSSHNEEGYSVHSQTFPERRRSYGSGGGSRYAPWYRQPQKLILAATLAWVGGVMYLATLAHAILKTHKETSHMMMGSSLMDNNEDFKEWLEARGMMESNNKYRGAASDEHVKQWLEKRSNKYGATNGAANDADYQEWLESKFGATSGGGNNAAANDADFQEWLGSRTNNRYGASAETNEDFQEWLNSQKYGATGSGNGKKNNVNVRFGSSGQGDAWQDWLAYLESEKSESQNSNNYGAANGNGSNGGNDAIYKVWSDYQNNKQVKYDADGMYGRNQNGAPNFGASQLTLEEGSKSSSSEQQQQQQPLVATSDASISTIDWPIQGLAHVSCTSANGCSPSTNVTVLIVYGPEYHTHISEMAWNVATGVHKAFQSHIKHHPSSPLHGHIVYGHTSNLTFLDVMDADAVIIGSPVYNGNVHPDVQNWINYWHIDADLSNKFGGAFATAGGIHAGADGTIMSILRSMMVFQMMAVGGDSWTSPFGAVATMYEDPFGDMKRTGYFDDSCYFTEDNGRNGDHLVHPYFLRKAYGLGERVANVTVAWKNSSYVRWD